MLVCKLKGGLGNQMFGYAAARALSIRTGRVLALDAGAGFEGDAYHRKYALGDFAVTAQVLTLDEAKRSAARHYFRSRVVRELENFGRNRLGYGHIGALHGVIASGDFYLDGYWQSEKYFSDSRAVIRAELTYARSLSNESRSIFSRIAASESVSVHVRRKDYSILCSEKFYRDACECVCSRIANPNFFFFSDDEAWTEMLIVNLRLPFPCTVVQSQVSDLEEFELMRACRHHIIANSTFSWWAAWLGESVQGVIVGPATGWSGKRMWVADVLPERWIQLLHE
jgi:hypothetical protein